MADGDHPDLAPLVVDDEGDHPAAGGGNRAEARGDLVPERALAGREGEAAQRLGEGVEPGRARQRSRKARLK
jgi:hypothetical protein